MSQQNYLGHAAIYSLTNVLTQVGALVMLVIYTNLLPPHEYGAYVLLTRLAETVSMVLLVSGFRQAFVTYYQEAETPEDRQRVLVGTYTLFVLAALVGGIALSLLAGPVWWLLGVTQPGGHFAGATLLQMAFFSVLLDPFCILPTVLLQVRLESRLYFLVSLLRLIGRIVLCTLLMLACGLGVGGALIGTALVNFVFALVLALRELRRGIVWPGRKQIGDMVRFAVPFLPGSLCFFLLHDGDRFFLAPWGTEQIGLYEIGYRLAQLVAPLALLPLVAVWNNRMYTVAKTAEAPVVFGRVFTWILSAYLLVGLGVCLFVEEALALAARSTYAGAAFFTPLVLIGCTFQAMASLMDSAFYIRKRTDLKLYVTLLTTVVMLVAYATLIPWLGATGAALATMLGFGFLALATWWTTRQLFPVVYQPPRLLALVGLVVVAWLVGRLVPLGLVTSPLKFLLWLAVPVIAWQLGLISSTEKEYLTFHARTLMARWSRRQTGVGMKSAPVSRPAA